MAADPEGVKGSGEGLTRLDLILKGALALGAFYGSGMVGPYLRKALAAGEGGDVGILNFLLAFEYVEADLYAKGERSLTAGAEIGGLVGMLAGEERQHVAALTDAVRKHGGEPVGKGSYAYSFSDPFAFFGLATAIEKAGVGAYNGAIPLFESEDLRGLAASIAQVEGRHAAIVLLQRGEEPSPEAFDPGRTRFQSAISVERFTGKYSL
jgi:hypothetical protein